MPSVIYNSHNIMSFIYIFRMDCSPQIKQRAHRPSTRADRPEVISERGRIIGMPDVGKTPGQIANETGLHVKTVRKCLRYWDEEGTLDTRARTRRPRVTTPQVDERILQAVEQNPGVSAVELTQQLHLQCSPETVRLRLNENGIRCYIPARKESLTQENKDARLLFARHYSQAV